MESSYTSDSKLEEKELFELINKLPSGYRKVFRMAVIDGFSHKEIAEKLGIDVFTTMPLFLRHPNQWLQLLHQEP